MEQTAVEWLIKQIEEKNNGVSNGMTYPSIFEQAKDMERTQLIDCGNSCAIKQHIHIEKVNKMTMDEMLEFANTKTLTLGEDYYNETFNK
jgi:hypothetical protein